MAEPKVLNFVVTVIEANLDPDSLDYRGVITLNGRRVFATADRDCSYTEEVAEQRAIDGFAATLQRILDQPAP